MGEHKLFEELLNRLWFTRKAWIYAEKRLLSNDFHTQLLMVVYAAYATCLAVVLLQYEPSGQDKKLVDTSMVVLSVILLALSLYLNSRSFKDRAAGFKSGYHDLNEIENEIKARTLSQPTVENSEIAYRNFSDRYSRVLREVENHADIDDIRSRVIQGKGLLSRHPSATEVLKYWWWMAWRFVSLSLAYSAPAIAVVWYFLK